MPESENLDSTVNNISGYKNEVLFDKTMDKGMHQVRFETDHLTSGIYLYEIMAGIF